jgi:DNA-binding NtrC family response regulator
MARAVVARSTRAAAPFVVIDVTSLPPALVDTVLFGQEKTATAEEARGLFESANGGTVFIDEVGQLSASSQSKLLRLLERQELTRTGGHVPIKIDVRVLGATSRDLRHEIEHNQFREDLYFRLAQVRIFVPPLRDRMEDIPLLCAKLLAASGGGGSLAIEEDALRQLANHPWPGNVRELRNALERASALAQDNVIRRADVAGEGFGFRGTRDERSALDLSGTFKVAKDRSVERFESAYLSALMRRCNGNVSLASREADLARHHLRDLLKKRELYGVAWDKGEE